MKNFTCLIFITTLFLALKVRGNFTNITLANTIRNSSDITTVFGSLDNLISHSEHTTRFQEKNDDIPFPMSSTSRTKLAQPEEQTEKKKRSVTWIFYVIVLGLTIPLILIFTWYQVKGIRIKEKLEQEIVKRRYKERQKNSKY